MQLALDFGSDEISVMRDLLRANFGDAIIKRREPIGQLVKSLISGRTRDQVSLGAYERLLARYGNWTEVANAKAGCIESVISDVTYADIKARQLLDTLRKIAAVHSDFDLTFLKEMTVAKALAWLETMPGVGRKVSASTLNFSTLDMPAFVVDTHVLRILRRVGFVRRNADIRAAYDEVMAATADWSAIELAELHVVLKHLGQTICRFDNAVCPGCSIVSRCEMGRHRLNRSSSG